MRTHQQPVTIRFEDADPAGIVFYPRAIALGHAVIEDMIAHSPLGWAAWFASPTHASPVRRAEVDFFVPMRAGETLIAHASVEAIGNTSVSFLVEFLDADRIVRARIRTVQVLVTKATGKPIPLTPAIRQAFA